MCMVRTEKMVSTNRFVVRFISDYLQFKTFFLHDIRQLFKVFNKLKKCQYEDIVTGKHTHSCLYDAFMVLICSILIEKRPYDRVHNSWISSEQVSNWKHIVLTTFYYFKLFFPATLCFYESPLYDKYAREGRRLILNSHMRRANTLDLTLQYDLCNMWNLKVKFIRGQMSNDRFLPYNIINNTKLIKAHSRYFTHDMVVTVSFDVIETLVDSIYTSFGYVVDNRRFVICKENTAFNKYLKVFKLKFIAHAGAPFFLKHAKIEQNTNLFFLFKNQMDLISLIILYNNTNNDHDQIKIPFDICKQFPVQGVKSIDNFFQTLCKVRSNKIENTPVLEYKNMDQELFKRILEEKGFASLYTLEESNTLAYAKNRVVHLTASFECPPSKKPFHEKKGKPLVKIEKMIRTMTISRYKSDMFHDNTVSFNINFQGSLNVLQLILCRFLNENKSLGCAFTSKIWTSNVCTTSDTVHAGILNPHLYREECLNSDNHLSYLMMNFPAVMTLINDKERVCPVINNRTSLNTCRLFGNSLKSSLKQHADLIIRRSEVDRNLMKIFFDIEKSVGELLPKSIILLIHLLYLYQQKFGYTNDDIVKFFRDKLLCSRMITASNRAFTTCNLYSKKYKSDAIDNVSIKSLKYFKTLPPLVSKDKMYKLYKKKFKDVGCLNRLMFQHRGRNANPIDLILNSKDTFFRSERCLKLLALLNKKYKNRPNTRSILALFYDFCTNINA